MAQASAERTERWGRSLGAEAPLLSSSGRSNHFLHSGYVCSLRVPPPGGGTGLSSTPSLPGLALARVLLPSQGGSCPLSTLTLPWIHIPDESAGHGSLPRSQGSSGGSR